MNNLKKKTNDVKKIKPKNKPKVRFIIEREYAGKSTFSELFEPIVEMMVREKYNEQIRL